MWRRACAPVALAMIVGALLLSTAPAALADYGAGAAYQIEISDNCNGQQACVIAKGDGLWLWIELTPASAGATWGTGDYKGADCVHGLQTPFGTVNGAASDAGDVTWSASGGTITINGVFLNGPGFPITITVPSRYGHYQKAASEILPTFPLPGVAQVQVAP
jgi:hypothetical protein